MAQNETRDEKGRFLPGNQAAVRHGGYAFLSSGGKVPSVRGTRKLKQELTRIRRDLEESCPNLNVKKQLIIDSIISSTGWLKLFENYVRKAGMIDPSAWKKKVLAVQPGFSFYLSMMNAQRNALLSLGLNEKKAEEILTPFELIEKEEEEQRQKDK